MITHKQAQKNHKAIFIAGFAVVWPDRYTAKKDTTKKKISIHRHQLGVVLAPTAQQECAINKNGVAKQCAVHNPLAKIPKLSGF